MKCKHDCQFKSEQMPTGNKEVKELTNAEFMNELMTGYSEYGAMVQFVVMSSLQNGLEDYVKHKDGMLAEYEASIKGGSMPLVNMHAFYGCVEETLKRFTDRFGDGKPKKTE